VSATFVHGGVVVGTAHDVFWVGYRGICQTRIAARDYAAVFAEAFGAFVKRGHTLGALPRVKNTF
jgi:hypothetical protein